MRTSSAEHVRLHRQRKREQGKTEILLTLPVETVEALDRLRTIQGAPNRGVVVASLVSLVQQLQEAGNELKNT